MNLYSNLAQFLKILQEYTTFSITICLVNKTFKTHKITIFRTTRVQGSTIVSWIGPSGVQQRNLLFYYHQNGLNVQFLEI